MASDVLIEQRLAAVVRDSASARERDTGPELGGAVHRDLQR